MGAHKNEKKKDLLNSLSTKEENYKKYTRKKKTEKKKRDKKDYLDYWN